MKTLEDFIGLFAEQFDDSESTVFTKDTKFHELVEWSSIVGLSVIAMVDEEFDVAIKSDDVRNSVTIEDLYNRIVSHLQ